MMVYTARGRRERTVRRILHTEWCRSGWSCSGDNTHARIAYRSIGAEVTAAPDAAAVLALLNKRCPVSPLSVRRRGVSEAERIAAFAAEPYVTRLLHALRLQPVAR